jgi:hypothetical protein
MRRGRTAAWPLLSPHNLQCRRYSRVSRQQHTVCVLLCPSNQSRKTLITSSRHFIFHRAFDWQRTTDGGGEGGGEGEEEDWDSWDDLSPIEQKTIKPPVHVHVGHKGDSTTPGSGYVYFNTAGVWMCGTGGYSCLCREWRHR